MLDGNPAATFHTSRSRLPTGSMVRTVKTSHGPSLTKFQLNNDNLVETYIEATGSERLKTTYEHLLGQTQPGALGLDKIQQNLKLGINITAQEFQQALRSFAEAMKAFPYSQISHKPDAMQFVTLPNITFLKDILEKNPFVTNYTDALPVREELSSNYTERLTQLPDDYQEIVNNGIRLMNKYHSHPAIIFDPNKSGCDVFTALTKSVSEGPVVIFANYNGSLVPAKHGTRAAVTAPVGIHPYALLAKAIEYCQENNNHTVNINGTEFTLSQLQSAKRFHLNIAAVSILLTDLRNNTNDKTELMPHETMHLRHYMHHPGQEVVMNPWVDSTTSLTQSRIIKHLKTLYKISEEEAESIVRHAQIEVDQIINEHTTTPECAEQLKIAGTMVTAMLEDYYNLPEKERCVKTAELALLHPQFKNGTIANNLQIINNLIGDIFDSRMRASEQIHKDISFVTAIAHNQIPSNFDQTKCLVPQCGGMG